MSPTIRRFTCPASTGSRTAREVLTLEWIDGVPLSDIERVAAEGYDLKAIGRNVLQSFLRHAMRDGFFHADMHQGNLFVDKKGRLVAIDFGIMGRLGLKERRFLAEILYGFITRDYKRVAEVHFEAGYVPASHSVEEFSQALRAIGEPMHTINAADISMARLLTLLFEVTALFDMRTRTELVLLQKTMVVAEGVARASIPSSTSGRPAIPSCAPGSRKISAPRRRSRTRARSRHGAGEARDAPAADIAGRRNGDSARERNGGARRRSFAALDRGAGRDAPKRSDRTLLIGLALVLFAAMWIFGR